MAKEVFVGTDTLIKGNVKVELEDIGEGYDGDYDENDPTDVALLRFTVCRRERKDWFQVDDASYCTNLPVATSDEQKQAALRLLMDEFYEPVKDGSSVKKLGEKLSWIDQEWLLKQAG